MQPEIVIKGSVLSEKAVSLSATGTYVLKVDLKATKQDIKDALKAVFGVDALSVNTSILRGHIVRKSRSRKSGAIEIKKPNVKKAYVQLRAGQTLPSVAFGEPAAEVQS